MSFSTVPLTGAQFVWTSRRRARSRRLCGTLLSQSTTSFGSILEQSICSWAQCNVLGSPSVLLACAYDQSTKITFACVNAFLGCFTRYVNYFRVYQPNLIPCDAQENCRTTIIQRTEELRLTWTTLMPPSRSRMARFFGTLQITQPTSATMHLAAGCSSSPFHLPRLR